MPCKFTAWPVGLKSYLYVTAMSRVCYNISTSIFFWTSDMGMRVLSNIGNCSASETAYRTINRSALFKIWVAVANLSAASLTWVTIGASWIISPSFSCFPRRHSFWMCCTDRQTVYSLRVKLSCTKRVCSSLCFGVSFMPACFGLARRWGSENIRAGLLSASLPSEIRGSPIKITCSLEEQWFFPDIWRCFSRPRQNFGRVNNQWL